MNQQFNSDDIYKLGGCLDPEDSTYVVRQADAELCQSLREGKYCYILNSRQMGKSSLRVQAMQKLRDENIICVAIDISTLSEKQVSPEQWYGGFLHHIVKQIPIQLDLSNWLKEHHYLSPLKQLSVFIDEEILFKISQNIVIFIDEIDRVLDLNFKEDFFTFIRELYNQRANTPKYKQLTFALLGVAQPSDFIENNNKTPFNINIKYIQLSGFKLEETEPLQKGFLEQICDSKKLLEEILNWTSGQPFLTQLVCHLIYAELNSLSINSESLSLFVHQLVQSQIIDNWQDRDYQNHFITIHDRFNKNSNTEISYNSLLIYQRLLHNEQINFDSNNSCHWELILSGLVDKKNQCLVIKSEIYQRIFNLSWLNKQLDSLSNPKSNYKPHLAQCLSFSYIPDYLNRLETNSFIKVGQDILIGMGFKQAKMLFYQDNIVVFKDTIIRESSDGMFRAEETWLVAFVRIQPKASNAVSGWNDLSFILQTAQKPKVENLLTVFFDKLSLEDLTQYHQTAKRAKIKSAIISDIFATDLVLDYSYSTVGTVEDPRFSFAQLRERMKRQANDATWRTQFQSLTALPTRVKPQQSDSILEEADLIRAAFKTHFFLLLGEPGAGKTTSLQVLAEELASAGGYTPVLMPLNHYSGDLLVDLGKVLGEETKPLSKEHTLALLFSGSLTIILDGINEVQQPQLQAKIVQEINQFTQPEHPATRSQWIVSGRKYDYAQARRAKEESNLKYLEQHTWELQPLTPDLIYTFLTVGLGNTTGKEVYNALSPTVRQICSNPLLLNMVVTVCRETKQIPKGRGSLYHQFIDLLLQWGEERDSNKKQLKTLSKALWKTSTPKSDQPLTPETYRKIVNSALTTLASEMVTTAIAWKEARVPMLKELQKIGDPQEDAPNILWEDLIRRGILKRNGSRLSFFHHTFQEYFKAFAISHLPTETLIPTEGVQGQQREVVVFVAGIIANPNPLVERALESDFNLAYDLSRETIHQINQPLLHRIAEKLWIDVLWGGRGWRGSQQLVAQKFVGLANQLGETPEQLARAIRQPSNEKIFLEELLRFYEELGDTSSRTEIFVRLGITTPEEVPSDLLCQAASAAKDAGNYQEALDLYTRYLQLNPQDGIVYNNRALVYQNLQKHQEALADFRRAIELNPNNGVNRTNLATLLIELDQKEEALKQLQTAIYANHNFPTTYFKLGTLLVENTPEEALPYLERAVEIAEPQNLINYTEKLAEVQDKTHAWRGAIRSFKHLIELNPTSYKVKRWKQKIAQIRKKLDEAEEQRSIRERLQQQGEVQLFDLAEEFFKVIGFKCSYATTTWLMAEADKSGLPSLLPVYVVDVPNLTGSQIRDAVESLPSQGASAESLVLFTPAEVLSQDARMQLLAYQSERPISLITSLEAQAALLEGTKKCSELLDQVLKQAKTGSNPFRMTNVVQGRLDFFGRTEDIREILTSIQNHQLVGLYGIHKIGKSSLMRHIQQNLIAYHRNITPLWIEINEHIKSACDLYLRILEALPDEIEIFSQGVISTSDFERYLKKFQQRQENKYAGHRIVLFLDEYAYLIPNSFGNGGIQNYLEVLGIFKTLYQQGRWFYFLPCGRTTALSRVGSWQEKENPFIGILQEKLLKPFTKTETDEMMKALGAKKAIEFTEAALEKIFAITGGHPQFTRILGDYISQQPSGEDVRANYVEVAANNYLQNGADRGLLQAIYEERLDVKEQEIAELLAISSQPLLRKQLIPQDASTEERRCLRNAIDNLLATSVLKNNSQDQICHSYELLRRVIEQEMGEPRRTKVMAQLSKLNPLPPQPLKQSPQSSSRSSQRLPADLGGESFQHLPQQNYEASSVGRNRSKKKIRNKTSNQAASIIIIISLAFVILAVVLWAVSIFIAPR